MDAKVKRKIESARRKRERGQAMGDEGTRELAAALAEARQQRAGQTKRPPPAHELAELAGLESREAVHRLVKWHEAGAEGSPWRR